VVVADPYRWLERADDPEVQRWLAGQDTLKREVLSGIPLRQPLREQLGKLLYAERLEAPKRGGTRSFFMLQKSGQEKEALYVRERADSSERALIDPNLWSEAQPRALVGFWPSKDGRKLVFSTSVNNADRETFQVLDVDSGAVSDVIDGVYDSFASWSTSGDGFYYRWSPSDPAIPFPDLPGHAEIRFHKLGLAPSSDRTIRGGTGDPGTIEYASASRDGNWLVMHVERGFSRQDVLVLDLRKPGATWTSILSENGVSSEAIEANDTLYVKTNRGASRGRVFSVDLAHPTKTDLREIVPERPDATLINVRVVGGRLVLLWLKDDISEIETCALDGSDRRRVALPGVGVASISGNMDDDRVIAKFESYTVPVEILEIDPRSATSIVWRRAASPINPDDYVTEELFYASKSAARIPMFIVHRRDVKPSGDAPTLYWGYGGFGIPVDVKFYPDSFAWLDRGGIYAEAAVRGGGDYGEDWHRAGMRAGKQNMIDDYLAGAEALVNWKWTRPDRIMACGGSNGGLLVGAAITERPELFGAAFIAAPLLDMVRYPLVGNGKQYLDEYGDPDDPTDLRALLSYSPYHHVKPGVRYPSTFIYTSDSDDRVDPMHARKFIAALQWATTGGPVVLAVAKNGGHTGPDGVEPRVERYADAYAFGLHAMGIDGPIPPSTPSGR
jgi:prolyl oligopeptidase